jgi:hypothetical protein
MDRKLHFHIHWIAMDVLDWELFDSYDDAVVGALRIARLCETFAIRECYGNCSPPQRKTNSPQASQS